MDKARLLSSSCPEESFPSGMKIHNYPGFFVDIEGLDGSGSRTQVRLVARALAREKIRVYTTKEPTRGPIGKLVRQALKGQFNSLPPASVQLLFAADRGRHLKKEIIPRLKKEKMIITDRYAWSSVAFGAVNLDREWLLGLNRDFILPDLTVFLEVSPHVCLKRLAKKKSSLELFKKRADLEQVWDTYHSLVSKYWWTHMAVVDGEQEEERVTEDILAHIKKNPKFRRIIRKVSS